MQIHDHTFPPFNGVTHVFAFWQGWGVHGKNHVVSLLRDFPALIGLALVDEATKGQRRSAAAQKCGYSAGLGAAGFICVADTTVPMRGRLDLQHAFLAGSVLEMCSACQGESCWQHVLILRLTQAPCLLQARAK